MEPSVLISMNVYLMRHVTVTQPATIMTVATRVSVIVATLAMGAPAQVHSSISVGMYLSGIYTHQFIGIMRRQL
jgi:hypothetical protein